MYFLLVMPYFLTFQISSHTFNYVIILIKGVEIIPVAIGPGINWKRIERYATKPSNIMNGTNFDAIRKKFEGLANILCKGRYK